MASTHTFDPDYAVAPGSTLDELIEERGMSQTELADRTGLARKTINEIIKGKAPLTPETAQKFELVLQTPAQFWNERERLFRQRLAAREQESELKKHLGWEKNFPYSELAARKAVPATGNALHKIWNLCRFFGISQPESIDKIFASLTISGTMFRRQSIAKPKPYLAWTWVRLAEVKAMDIATGNFDTGQFEKCVRAVPGRSASVHDGQSLNTFIDATIESFRMSGVALVLVPEFAGAAINGAAFWRGNRPIIAVTLRGKRLDGLVFTLLHEAAHVLHHGKKVAVVDAGTDGKTGEGQKIEREADNAAAEWCIAKEFDSKIMGLQNVTELNDLSAKIKVHPELIIGRYAKLTNDYRRFSSLRMKLSWKVEVIPKTGVVGITKATVG